MKPKRPGQKRYAGGKGGVRIYIMHDDPINLGLRRVMYLGTTAFGGGSVRLSGLTSVFPGRRGHRKGVPSRHLNVWVETPHHSVRLRDLTPAADEAAKRTIVHAEATV